MALPAVAALREWNEPSPPGPPVAITKVRLIDGRGGTAVDDAVVVVRDGKIAAVGSRQTVKPPRGIEVFDAAGLTLLPGLIDSHFHLDGAYALPGMFLRNGITSARDPGAWIESYAPLRKPGAALPRLFLTGPHLDMPPPAYPKNSLLVKDADDARAAVRRFSDQGGSAIKVYFRLRLEIIRSVVEEAHRLGIPVTAHLELVDADDAIRAGIDGIEHVTSVGTAIAGSEDAERFRAAVAADNDARRDGRYDLWSHINLDSPRVAALLALMKERRVFLSPTLAVFERRAGDRATTGMHVRGFQNMLRFTGMARRAGIRVVAGSHSNVPHAPRGFAYHREMDLLVESGLSPMEAIVAGTSDNARFFRIDDKLGTIEGGKTADLILVEGDPLADIAALRKVRRVMLNGRWQ
jgi:imidazolonepropionase-like amidohydrolase